MAKATAKSDVFAQIGAKANKVLAKTKNKEVKVPGGGNLPAGIEGGVARLTSVKFAKYEKGDNKGKPYFMAQGVVVNPDGTNKPYFITKGDGTKVKVSGMTTKFGPEPLCDTPAKKGQAPGKNARLTFDDHMDYVFNLFKLLAGKKAVQDIEDAAELQELGDQLIEAGTYFELRTWSVPKRKKGDPGFNPKYDGPDAPPPRVFETWGSGLPDFTIEDGDGSEVEDEEEVEDVEVEETEDGDESGEEESDDAEEESDEESEDAEEESDEDDGLDELAEAADAKKVSPAKEKAAKELTKKAIEAGYTKKEVEAAEDFAAVVEMIRNPKDEESEETEESEEEETEEETKEEEEEEEAGAPEVGSEYKYKPKGAKKAIDVEVTKVNEAKGLAFVKDASTKKAILDPKTKKPLGIPFDQLEAVE